MATVQLADVIEPQVFMDYETNDSPERTAFYESGVVTQNAMLNNKANTGGKVVDLPFWNDLDATDEPNLSSDNPASSATPGKITAGDQIARIAYLNNGWSASDLAGEIAGSDPMARIRARTDTYWRRQWQRRLVQSAMGILADNVANDSGDMVHNIATDAVGSPAAAEKFSRTAFTAAAFTLGDAFENTGVLAVHSVIYQTMVENEDITFIPDSQGNLTIPTYLGRRVVVDDGMPAVAGTNRITYTSVLFGEGAFGFGEGMPKVPVAVSRNEEEGDGAGIETLWTRKTYLLHPAGFAFTSSSVSGNSPSLAELATAANWNRVVDRKNVPVAFLQTNG